MKHTSKLKNKCIATALTAALAVSAAVPAGAAESTWKDVEKAALKSLISDITTDWDSVVDSYTGAEEAEGDYNFNLTLKPEEGAIDLLSTFLSDVDMSWFQNIGLDVNASVKDGMEAAIIGVLLNEKNLCDVNMYIDLANLTEYIQIPELSESWLGGSMGSMEVTAESAGLPDFLSDPSMLISLLPDADAAETLLDRYGNIIIDGMEEGDTSEETLSVEGVEEDCTVYEGVLNEANAVTLIKEVLSTARDDEEIKGIFDQYAEKAGDTEAYTNYQSSIDNLLGQLGTEDSADAQEAGSAQTLLSSRIWVNAEGKIVGREIGNDAAGIVWRSLSKDGTNAILLELGGDGMQTITFTGTGTSEDGILNGNYTISAGGEEILDIAVENLGENADAEGYYDGVIHVSMPAVEYSSEESESEVPLVTEESADAAGTESEESETSEGSDSSAYASDEAAVSDLDLLKMLGLGLDITLTGDPDAESQSMDLTVNMSESKLATLSITAGKGEAVEIPDVSSLQADYDLSTSSDIENYMAEISWDTLLDNLTAAGLPSEFVQQAELILQSVSENAAEMEESSETDSAAAVIGGSDASTEIELTEDAA